MALTETQIQELYVAYFGRPADPDGKDYWMSSAAGAPTDRAFASHMHGQAEFQDAYGSMSTQAQVNQLYQNLFNRDADATGLAYWTGEITQGNLKLADIAVNLIHAAKNPSSGNSVQGAADATALENKVAAAKEFTSDVKADATAILAYTSDDATAFDTAKTFINSISATAHTSAQVDTQVTSIKDSYTENTANKGTTYALTTAADNFTGGRLNDTFNGVVDSDANSGQTFTIADIIDGGAGTDTLSWTVDAESATTGWPAAAITNVEIFKIRNVEGAAVSVDLADVAGETKAVNNLSTSQVNFDNAISGTVLDIVGNGTLTNGATTFDLVTAATSATINFKDGTVGTGAVTIDGSGVLTETINSTGAANATGAYTVSDNATTLTINATTNLTFGDINSNIIQAITVTGAGAVDTGTAAGTRLANLYASTNTGGVTFVSGTYANSTTQDNLVGTVDVKDVTIEGGSGNDSITLADLANDIETQVTLASGNDTLVIAEAIKNVSDTNVGDVFNGGAGTDVISATQALATAQGAITTVTNFETLKISDILDGAITPGNFQAGLDVELAAGFAAGTVTFATGGGTVNLTGTTAATGALTVVASGDATTDIVTIDNNTDDLDAFATQAIVATEVETLILNTTGVDGTDTDTTSGTANVFGAITLSVDTGGASLVKFVGDQSATTGAITADTVDASGLTGTTGFSNTGAAAATLTTDGTFTFTGSAGTDVIVGDTGDSNVISGGAGNDTITGGDEVDTLNGEAGNDTINMGGTVASTISGGAGNDTVVAAANLTFGQSVTGGAGTDTLSITTNNITAANGSVVSGFETLLAAGALTADLGNFGNNTFTTLDVTNANISFDSWTSETLLLDVAITAEIDVDTESASTVTTDSINLTMKSDDALDHSGTIDLTGFEGIVITTDDTENAGYETDGLDLDADDVTSITISGDKAIDFTGSSIDSLLTLDASGITNTGVASGVTWASDNTTVGANLTWTGSAGADHFTGLATSDDTFSGGAGVDTLIYKGTSANSLGGTDTFTGGAGNDLFDIDGTGTNTNSAFLTITDITAGDTINFATIDAAGVTGAESNAAIARATTFGTKASLGSSATFLNYLDNATSTNVTSAASVANWFQHGGNTFITVDNSSSTSYDAGVDAIVKLTGEIDLSSSTWSSAVLTIV